jgi:hypothetical protein
MCEFGFYEGLPGVAGRITGTFADSVASVMRKLRTYRIVSCNGSMGSVSVWIDDEGGLWCEFYQYGRTMASARPTSNAEVRKWLEEWLPKTRLTAQRPANRHCRRKEPR